MQPYAFSWAHKGNARRTEHDKQVLQALVIQDDHARDTVWVRHLFAIVGAAWQRL